MAAPEVLSKVGFEKTKIGAGDKETGYQIEEGSLSSLVGSACLCFLVMGLMVVSMVFDVHFEKKTLHRQLRVEEHHAAGKLAQVQMELWSEFHSDIKESQEAVALLNHMNQTYGEFQGKIKGVVTELAAEVGLNEVKAAKFADKLLHVVADLQEQNVKHAQRLVDHLVSSAKRSKKLEKHVDQAMLKEAAQEKQHLMEDKKEGIDVTKTPEAAAKSNPEGAANATEDEEDPLKEILTGFFATFHDHEQEFKGGPKEKMQDGNEVYEQVKTLYGKVKSETNPLGEEDIQAELNKIDLTSVGAGLGSGRVLDSSADIVEELFLIPKIPHEKLLELEQKWKKGEADPMAIFEELQELHEQNQVPSGWLQEGADDEMKQEEQHAKAAEENNDAKVMEEVA